MSDNIKVGDTVKVNPFVDLEMIDERYGMRKVGVTHVMLENQAQQKQLTVKQIYNADPPANNVLRYQLNDLLLYKREMLIVKGVDYM